MTHRWTLSRAGILNVYQYGDEVLHFAGGRLLLRGVNGSGKSTAMNMLLPFLLDADTRRIDAAGEQTGVLRSWMLSGRDEQQPVGYLWIEFERGHEHLVCGCGIRANRSTETVNTWWFVTAQRPGIDFTLVESRVPLSADALKATLGPGSVFTKDQRQAYRTEVRNRLFGGADIDQHISLLHVVRSPRVGDRIDTDLPGYLNDALPQLSDAAIDDAAQPLEDLEDYRRNVAALTTTAAALDALVAVYRSYACTELRRRADEATSRVAAVRSSRRAETSARLHLGSAEAELANARAVLLALEAEERRLVAEITAMRELPAYLEGKGLEDLRGRVNSLGDAVDAAAQRLTSAQTARGSAARSAESAQSTFGDDVVALTGLLTDLAATCSAAGIAAMAPDAPMVRSVEEGGAVGPDGPLHVDAFQLGVSNIRTSLGVRRGDVAQVRQALDRVTEAEATLRRSEHDAQRAGVELQAAHVELSEAHNAVHRALEEFRTDLRHWLGQATAAMTPAAMTPGAIATSSDIDIDIDIVDLLDQRDAVRAVLAGSLTTYLDELRHTTAALGARRDLQTADVEQRRAEVDELMARSEPELRTAPWQNSTDSVRLGQLIDFHPSVDGEVQRGLEAALEAAGLLGAELGADGFHLHTGDLIVTADHPVSAPLSDVITVAIPEDLQEGIRRAQIDAVLESISTDPNGAATTVIATDGSFRIGALSGRHHKDTVEFVGAAARSAALERNRDEARTRLLDAGALLSSTEAELVEQHRRIDAGQQLSRQLPTTAVVDRSVMSVETHQSTVDARQRLLDQCMAEVERSDAVFGDLSDNLRRAALTLGLPHTVGDLAQVDSDLDAVADLARSASERLTTVSRSCQTWTEAADRSRAAIAVAVDASVEHGRLVLEREPLAMKLATLEDTLGVAYAEVIETIELSAQDLSLARRATPAARDAAELALESKAGASASVDSAATRSAEAERHCIAVLPVLRAALSVAGLRAAIPSAAIPSAAIPSAAIPEGMEEVAELPVVTESSDGVQRLAEFVRQQVPEPDSPTTADGVRQSLARRRDTLGAGWDAEARQPDESLPLHIEVNGPLGRMPLANAATEVRNQLRDQSSLLTSQQDQALRNLLQGLIAREVAEKLHSARSLVDLMNDRLETVETSHGIRAELRWRRRDDLDDGLGATIDLLAKPPDLRTPEEDRGLAASLSARIEDARRQEPEAPYRQLIGEVLDYRRWHDMSVLLHRPGQKPERLSRRTNLSEGEKKMVSYLPLFAAVAASCDALSELEPAVPRFVLLDDAFAKVSEDNHAKLFGLLVDLDLDFIATSERLWGTHSTVPELAITEVIRDAASGVIVLEHARWDGRVRTALT